MAWSLARQILSFGPNALQARSAFFVFFNSSTQFLAGDSEPILTDAKPLLPFGQPLAESQRSLSRPRCVIVYASLPAALFIAAKSPHLSNLRQ
jgi:hypothetical protein